LTPTIRSLARLRPPARNAYQRLFNRGYWHERARFRDFLRQFVPNGSLAFDVGAHRGRYAETLLELGARVVAVEPNPALAAKLRDTFPKVQIVEAAVGSKPGRATLIIGRYDEHSTLSGGWAAAHPDRWTGELEVAVTTLDALVETYGRPDFVKIDVEGFEDEVVDGLTTPLPVLSFEYQTAAPQTAVRTSVRLGQLGKYEFAIAGDRMDWIDATRLASELQRLAASDPATSGDVYARQLA
jgi:FkbM family methyltransferase